MTNTVATDVWRRESPVSHSEHVVIERWTPPADRGAPFDLEVRVGKPLDVVGFKGIDLADVRCYADLLRGSVSQLYGDVASLETVETCPACSAPAEVSVEVFGIFGIPYHRCERCGHGYIRHRPTTAAFTRHFQQSDDHAGAYVDPEAAVRRIDEIVRPKLEWLLDLYLRNIGRRPATGVDVGAGGGHFVAAARQSGIAMNGFELSSASRRFAAECFGLELDGSDFLESSSTPVDVITFWGLLEYVPEPRRFLTAARARLQPGQSMLVAEVPRLEAVGTVAQATNPTTVARHMDPSSHINCFGDTALFTALIDTGFRPIAAWYFGMDAYELLVQLALRADDDALIARWVDMIAPLQGVFDRGRSCDDIIVGAVPV